MEFISNVNFVPRRCAYSHPRGTINSRISEGLNWRWSTGRTMQR